MKILKPGENIEEQIEVERERDVALAEVEHLRATLAHLLMFARGNEHVLGIIRAALDWRYEGGLRAGEFTATHTGPLTAEQMDDG